MSATRRAQTGPRAALPAPLGPLAPLALVVALVVAVGQAACQGPSQQPAPLGQAHQHEPVPPGAPMAEEAPRRFTCPMHPGYVADQPGLCPICNMKLVPVARPAPATADGGVRPGAGVTVDGSARTVIGLRTVLVERRALTGEVRAVARVAVDERRVAQVQPRFDGFVEWVGGRFVGQQVRRGELLARVYSPEVLATQQEMVLADGAGPRLSGAGLDGGAAAAEGRLRLLGMGRAQIAAVRRSGVVQRSIALRAPRAGVITVKNVVAGARVGTDAVAFEITDLSRLWVLADVYEADLPRLRLGQRATVTVPYWPGRSWSGRATFIAPILDERTRTVRVRIELPNPAGELRPAMFAEVVLLGAPRQALVVPEDAVIETGARQLAFVDAAGDGRLESRVVTIGQRSGGKVEILTGLSEGERVATGSAFLLDSEARLRTMGAPATGAAP